MAASEETPETAMPKATDEQLGPSAKTDTNALEESGTTDTGGGQKNGDIARVVTLKVEETETGVTLHISVPQRS